MDYGLPTTDCNANVIKKENYEFSFFQTVKKLYLRFVKIVF